MLTFVSRWMNRKSADSLSNRDEIDRDTPVAFVAGEGARVYSLDAYRSLKKLPATSRSSPAPANIA
jgi:hypothetical protein